MDVTEEVVMEEVWVEEEMVAVVVEVVADMEVLMLMEGDV